MATPRILIVEDDQFLSSLLKTRFEREGFAVFQAFDGGEGLAVLREEHPDAVLLDLIMPKTSGFEMLKRMSEDPEIAGTPVLIASNLGQESDVEKAKSLGAAQYYVKVRTSIDDLVQMVKNFITKIKPQ